MKTTAFVIANKDTEQIVDNFNMATFEFDRLPRIGEQVVIRNGSMAPPKVYLVETVRDYGSGPDVTWVEATPKTELYLSFLFTDRSSL